MFSVGRRSAKPEIALVAFGVCRPSFFRIRKRRGKLVPPQRWFDLHPRAKLFCYNPWMSEVTRILQATEDDPKAAEVLLTLLYDELRELAAAKLARENPGHTLQATVLVHEAWLRLVKSDVEIHWNGRGHFFGAAARAMQRILVENARRKRSLKAGGDYQRVELSEAATQVHRRPVDVLDVNEALEKLESKDHRKAELVRMRYFAGLTLEEAAKALGISVSTADNDWAYAKAWLRLEMAESD